MDDPPSDVDPFLPWIHDAFPNSDGSAVQFVAQNRRRCQSGSLMGEVKRHLRPQGSLFQHVPVRRVSVDDDGEVRYRLSSHEEADPDGIETRFICRYKTYEGIPVGESLSVHNLNYDYRTYRQGYVSTFTEEGFDNHMIWSSQLLFQCPVPEVLRDRIKSGGTVNSVTGYANLFLDLIPIRTPPRYGLPREFLPPRYGIDRFLEASDMWGDRHVLPRAEDSGRWENIPVCAPSLITYGLSDGAPGDGETDPETEKEREEKEEGGGGEEMGEDKKRWDVIACTWMSETFYNRGDGRLVTDNARRLREWLEWNLLVGFDHVVVYDNSGAQRRRGSRGDGGPAGNGTRGEEEEEEEEEEDDGARRTLRDTTDLFPGRVTWIDWPSRVCNNNPENVDNKGERSSQYAAESSCRLRFGPHAEWLGSFDIDEYLVPMGDFGGLREVVEDAERRENSKIVTFKSMRSWPRADLLK